MTRLLLCLTCAVFCLPLSLASGQVPTPHPAPKPAASYPNNNIPLDGNYVLTVSTADKKGPDFSVLIAAQGFFVNDPVQAGVSFSAQLLPQENGGFLMYYDLVQHGATTVKSTVFLRPGEPVQLLKNSEGFCNARLERYNASPTPAAKGGG